MKTAKWRMVSFHLSADASCVVEPHPQAKSKSAKEQGTVLLRFDPMLSLSFRRKIVAWLNAGHFDFRNVYGAR